MPSSAVRILTAAALLFVLALDASAQTPVSLFRAFTGDVNYVATGGSLRTNPNSGGGANPCAVGPNSTAALNGIPPGSTIRAAMLYWAGSYLPGTTPADYNITFNGANHTATRTFTATFNANGNNYDFFSGYIDVTPQVTGNGNYQFSNLTVHTGAPHCAA
ncbi:MAG: hypothetical protein KJO55_05110, partial [Gammaproteobacteria bacterium]|nr:hypothetical protein [Gammaproteobacteria bacterium]